MLPITKGGKGGKCIQYGFFLMNLFENTQNTTILSSFYIWTNQLLVKIVSSIHFHSFFFFFTPHPAICDCV